MPKRRVKLEELVFANVMLFEIRARLIALNNGDRELQFVYRRKIFKELSYDERNKPAVRRKLKNLKRQEQHNILSEKCSYISDGCI